jgi:hypothetical protein
MKKMPTILLLENLDGKEKVPNFALAFEKHHNGG